MFTILIVNAFMWNVVFTLIILTHMNVHRVEYDDKISGKVIPAMPDYANINKHTIKFLNFVRLIVFVDTKV